MVMIRKHVLILFAAFFLAACTLAPVYKRPAAPTPSDWPKGAAYKEERTGAKAPMAYEISWQEYFRDEHLREIIATALKNNRDLRIAALNVEVASAIYGVQRASLLPTVDASATRSKGRVPADANASQPGTTVITDFYSVNLGILSWEVDLFGRLRSLKDKALEEYLATDYVRRGAQISLVSEVATAYLMLAADKENLRLTRSTLAAQQSTYDLIRRRFDVGLATELDLNRAQTQVDAARASLALYTQLVATDKNTLDLLAGTPVPDEITPVDLKGIAPLGDISAGAPSETLLHRPDILAAEHELKAVNANIGAARAAFFPSIFLTTTVGTESFELSRLFKADSSAWTFQPQAIMPIFDARLWSSLKGIKVQREIAVAQYEKAIQVAFKEVADALAERGTVGDQLAAQESLVHASEEAYRLSDIRYSTGIDSYLSVLDAQRSLYAAEQGLITIRLARLINMVTLYKVLGGGDNLGPRTSP